MMRKLVPILALLVTAALALSGCGDQSWNQKLTMKVQTPSGEVSGSAVTAVNVSYNAKILPDAKGMNVSWQGEATVVDLGNGRYLFALIGNQTALAQAAFQDLLNANEGSPKLFYPALRKAKGQPALLPTKAYPLLVTFTDIADPKTVVKVDPANLAATFGPGYALTSITLEITDEPLTEGVVEKVLGWSPGDGSLDKIWHSLTSGQRSILSSVNWTQG